MAKLVENTTSAKPGKNFEVHTFKTAQMPQSPSKVAKDGQSRSKKPANSDLKIILVEKGIKEHQGTLVACMNEKYCENADLPDLCVTSTMGNKAHNAFFQFRMDAKTKARYSNLPGPHQQSAIVKAMGAEWRAMSKEQKQPYEDRADQARYEYNYARAQHQLKKQHERSSLSSHSKNNHILQSSNVLSPESWTPAFAMRSTNPRDCQPSYTYHSPQHYELDGSPVPSRPRTGLTPSVFRGSDISSSQDGSYSELCTGFPPVSSTLSAATSNAQQPRYVDMMESAMISDYSDAAVMHALSANEYALYTDRSHLVPPDAYRYQWLL